MSKIVVDTFEDRSAGESVDATYVVHGTAKVWANLDGTGTISLRDSINVSGVTDNSTGDYTYTFSNALTNTSFSDGISGNQVQQNNAVTDRTTSTARFVSRNSAGTGVDDTFQVPHIFGDLA